MAKKQEPLSESKKNIIASLLQEYDIKTADGIQEALKELLGELYRPSWKQEWMIIWDMLHMNVQTIRTPAMAKRVKPFVANMVI